MIKAIKNKRWLPENNYLEHLSTKEHYTNAFKSIIQTIKENEKSIRQGITCPSCHERNIGTRNYCYKCGNKLKKTVKISQ